MMDHELIHSWYQQYKTSIFRYALSILKDQQLAEDVLQDTFLRLISGKGFPSPGKEQPWLYRVARNLCFDKLRRLRKESPEMEISTHEHQYEYIDLIAPLSPKDQEIVTLKIIGGLTHKEIGLILGISPKAAQKRYQRAIDTLRKDD